MEPLYLGKLIKKMRMDSGFTINEFCEGICSRRQLLYIESGNSIPSALYLELILNKLNVSNIDDLLKFSSYDNSIFVFNAYHKIDLLKYTRKFQELYDYISYLKTQEEFKNNELQRFLLWNEGICQEILYQNYAEAIQLFDQCLYFDIFVFVDNPSKIYLAKDDFEILNSYAICLSNQGKHQMALDILETLESKLSNNSFFDNKFNLHLKIVYNLTKILMTINDYKSSLKFTNKGIELSKKSKSMTYLGNFYYQKADCCFTLGIPENITRYLVLAYNLFDIQDKKNLKEIVVDKSNKKFNITILQYIDY